LNVAWPFYVHHLPFTFLLVSHHDPVIGVLPMVWWDSLKLDNTGSSRVMAAPTYDNLQLWTNPHKHLKVVVLSCWHWFIGRMCCQASPSRGGRLSSHHMPSWITRLLGMLCFCGFCVFFSPSSCLLSIQPMPVITVYFIVKSGFLT